MAEIAAGNFVDTQEIVADEKIIDMDPKMRLLDPDQTQFTTMTQRMPSRQATREKFNWLEESYVSDVYTAAAYTAGATTITLTGATDAFALKPNDTVRNMRTGQAFLVTAVNTGTGVITVTPFGTNAAGNAGDKLVFTGSAHPQGAPLPQPKYSQRVLGYNYTQIFRS